MSSSPSISPSPTPPPPPPTPPASRRTISVGGTAPSAQAAPPPPPGPSPARGGSHGLRDDELSKRMYIGGCFGLPWLWIVHVLYWYTKQRTAQDAMLETEGPPRDPSNPGDDDTMIANNQRAWVKKCRNSAVVVTAIWVTWVVIVQVVGSNRFPYGMYVRSPDENDYSGW